MLDFNFLEERARTEYTLKTRSIKTIFDLDYRPVKGLKLYTQFGLQVDNSATEKMAQENTYFTRKYQLKSMVDQVVRLPKGGVIQNWNGDLSQYNWKAQAEYACTFGGKHELDLMAGLEMRGVTNTTVHTKGFGYDHKTMTTKPINVPEDSDLLACTVLERRVPLGVRKLAKVQVGQDIYYIPERELEGVGDVDVIYYLSLIHI